MTPTPWARLCAAAAIMSVASFSKAGVWGSQPVISVAGDYYTNPALIDLPDTSESHGSLLVDAPTSYVGDAYKLTVLPSFRLSNAPGYSYLDSNYAHVNVSNEFDTARSTVVITGAVARDSSLYHDYLLNGATGVRRDSVLADLNWDRQFTERFDLDTDVTWTRVRFGEAVGVATLTDYKYANIAPALNWALSETTKLTVSAGFGRYDSLDGITQSTSANLQVGMTKQVSELWTLSAAAGYSRAENRYNLTEYVFEFTPVGILIVPVPFSAKSAQNGGVYALSASHRTELLTLSASASQQWAPTGFAFLSRQKLFELAATYRATERLTVSADVRRLDYDLPQGAKTSVNLDLNYLDLTATWQWTEHWTATATATYVMERYVASDLRLSSTGVSLAFSRHFDWKSFH
jgi:hypothetical protein